MSSTLKCVFSYLLSVKLEHTLEPAAVNSLMGMSVTLVAAHKTMLYLGL